MLDYLRLYVYFRFSDMSEGIIVEFYVKGKCIFIKYRGGERFSILDKVLNLGLKNVDLKIVIINLVIVRLWNKFCFI